VEWKKRLWSPETLPEYKDNTEDDSKNHHADYNWRSPTLLLVGGKAERQKKKGKPATNQEQTDD
jgi:hypothetical protein